MIHFVGAGSGAPDLITVRGQRLLAEADIIIYAGSLVNPALLEYKKKSCRVYDSAGMTLEQVTDVMRDAEKAGLSTVRLHTGDPCIYGAIVHPARNHAERDHHPHGRPDTYAGKGVHRVFCGTRGNNGDLFEHRDAGKTQQ